MSTSTIRSRGPSPLSLFFQFSKLFPRNPKWAAPQSHFILFAFSRNPEINLPSVCVLILQVRMSPSLVFPFFFGSYHYDSLLNKELFCCHIQELCQTPLSDKETTLPDFRHFAAIGPHIMPLLNQSIKAQFLFIPLKFCFRQIYSKCSRITGISRARNNHAVILQLGQSSLSK